MEIATIAAYGRKDLGLGNLVNLTNGGEGDSGRIPSPETLIKRSKALKGKRTGHTHSKETKLKMSELRKGKDCGNWLGRCHNENSRIKQSKAKLGKKRLNEDFISRKNKRVTNGLICFYNTAAASRYFNLGASAVLQSIKRKTKSAGFNWEYI